MANSEKRFWAEFIFPSCNFRFLQTQARRDLEPVWLDVTKSSPIFTTKFPKIDTADFIWKVTFFKKSKMGLFCQKIAPTWSYCFGRGVIKNLKYRLRTDLLHLELGFYLHMGRYQCCRKQNKNFDTVFCFNFKFMKWH